MYRGKDSCAYYGKGRMMMVENTPISAGHRCRWKIVVVSLGVLVFAVVGAAWFMQFPALEQKPIPEQADFSSGRPHKGPRIVNDSLVEGERPPHQGHGPGVEEEDEPLILSWDFINGLFAAILVLEFIIFPILFWVWFGPIHKK